MDTGTDDGAQAGGPPQGRGHEDVSSPTAPARPSF